MYLNFLAICIPPMHCIPQINKLWITYTYSLFQDLWMPCWNTHVIISFVEPNKFNPLTWLVTWLQMPYRWRAHFQITKSLMSSSTFSNRHNLGFSRMQNAMTLPIHLLLQLRFSENTKIRADLCLDCKQNFTDFFFDIFVFLFGFLFNHVIINLVDLPFSLFNPFWCWSSSWNSVSEGSNL